MATQGQRIAFDLDNVIADSIGSFCTRVSKLTRKTISKDGIKSHKIVGSVPLPPREIFRLQDEVWKDWKSVYPTEEGIPDMLNQLKTRGHEVYIVTSRPSRFMDSVGL